MKNGEYKITYSVSNASEYPITAYEAWYSESDTAWTSRKWIKAETTVTGNTYEISMPESMVINGVDVFLTVSDARAVSVSSMICTAGDTLSFENKNDDAVRIGIVSDAHINSADSAKRLKKAFEAFYETDRNIDGIILNGDIVAENASSDVYDTVLETKNKILGDTNYVWNVGDGEYTQSDIFKAKTGQDLNTVKTFGGYTVIAAGVENTSAVLSSSTEEWLKEQIKTAADNSSKPVFLTLHRPIQNTVESSSAVTCSEEFKTFLKNYPNVIVISSHTHIPSQNPNTIYQDGFTSVSTPYLGENGFVNVDGKTDSNTPYQAMMLEIDNGIVKIYKLDIATKQYIGNPWIIDVPSLVGDTPEYLYTNSRKTNSNTPNFEDNASITIGDISNSAVTISFPQAANTSYDNNSQDGFVIKYIAKLYESETDRAVKTVDISSGYDTSTKIENMPNVLTAEIDGLISGTKYYVSATPVSPFGKYGNTISSESFRIEMEKEIPQDGSYYMIEKPNIEKVMDNSSKGLSPTADQKKLMYVVWTEWENESVSAAGERFQDFNVYAYEEGWYNFEMGCGNNIDNTAEWEIIINCEKQGTVSVPSLKHWDWQSEYFAIDSNDGNIWLPKGYSTIRIRNVGEQAVYHKVRIKRNSSYDAVPSDSHSFNAKDYSRAIHSTSRTTSDEFCIDFDNYRYAEMEAANEALKFEIAVPKSGLYDLTVYAGTTNSSAQYTATVNSQKDVLTKTIAATSANNDIQPNNVGRIYLYAGKNTIRIGSNNNAFSYFERFTLSLAEEKTKPADKIVLFPYYTDRVVNGGSEPHGTVPYLNAGALFTYPQSSYKYTVNIPEAGMYNVLGNFWIALDRTETSKLAVYVNGTEYNGWTICGTKVNGATNSTEEKIGSIYLQKGSNEVTVKMTTGWCTLWNALTFARAESTMYHSSVTAENATTDICNGTLIAKCNLNGAFDEGTSVRCIFAIYDNDDKLSAISSKVVTATFYDDIEVEITDFVQENGKTYSAKAFMWDTAMSGECITLTK